MSEKLEASVKQELNAPRIVTSWPSAVHRGRVCRAIVADLGLDGEEFIGLEVSDADLMGDPKWSPLDGDEALARELRGLLVDMARRGESPVDTALEKLTKELDGAYTTIDDALVALQAPSTYNLVDAVRLIRMETEQLRAMAAGSERRCATAEEKHFHTLKAGEHFKQRADAAEAKLAKAVEALESIATYEGWAGQKARAVLDAVKEAGK